MSSWTDNLISYKLYAPQSMSPTFTRHPLITRLNEGLDRKVTLISAPAGYGKTTLVGDWLRQLDRPAGWFSLEERDNDLIRFWQYLLAALDRSAASRLTCKLGEALALLRPGNYEPFLVQLLNTLAGWDQPLLLVLDDWHLIDNADIHGSMTSFIEYIRPSVHLCFTSRSSIRWTKARWSARDWLNEYNASDLRFSTEEIMELYRLQTGQPIQRDDAEELFNQSEGWVVGLKLLSLSGSRTLHKPSFSELASGDGVKLEQFLMEEVLQALAPKHRLLLLRLSVLHRFNLAACRLLSPESDVDEQLQELIHVNLFLIPLDEEQRWFRFHHLFGAFLRRQLLVEHPDLLAELYSKAGQWCEQEGMLEDAAEYYLTGGHYGDALRLLEQMKSLMIRRGFSTLRSWLSMIPAELLRKHSYLYFTFIYSLLWDQEPEQAELQLLQAEQYAEQASDTWSLEERDRYLGYLYYVRNFKATQYDMDMVQGLHYIRLSLQYSPRGTDLIFAAPHLPLCPSIYRSYNGKTGRHLPRGIADDFFNHMIAFMTPMHIEESIIVCYGELLYERGELEQAEARLKQGLGLSSRTPHQPEKVYVPAYLFLSRVHRARGDELQARHLLEKAEARVLAELNEPWEALILIDAELALMSIGQGDNGIAEAFGWLEKYGLASDDPISVYQLHPYTFVVRILLEACAYEEALTLSKRLMDLAEKGHRPMDLLSNQVLTAILLQRLNRPEEAILTLEDALTDAEHDDYVRIFTDQGPGAAELLVRYIQYRQKGSLRDKHAPSLVYVRRILAGFRGLDTAAGRDETALETLLTKREMMIFHCMEEGMNNPSIAERLGIGMGTLKAHINHIYSKLQVSGRVEAIRRGKELNHSSEGQ